MNKVRAITLVFALAALGALNVVGWRERTVTATTTEINAPAHPTLRSGASAASNETERAIERGRDLFQAKGCAACHVDFNVGPSLTNVAQRAGKTKSDLTADQYLRESIVAPNAFKASGGNGAAGGMPTLAVSAEELTSLVAYLLTL